LKPQYVRLPAERIHELMAGKSPFSPPLEERLQRLERINSSNVLLALIRDAEPVEVRLAAIAALQDDMCLQDIALHSSIARLRQAAAERITTLPLLEELMQASKLKDKTVYRIVKGRLDEIRDKEKAETERQERAVTLCELMEAHARSALNPLYAAKTESLRMQWNELTANHSFSVAERFATAHALACRQVADIVAAEQLAADQTQAREELSRALETLESTVKEYRGQDDFDVSSLAAVRKTQRLRWELACELHSPAANLVQRYESAMQKLDSLEALLAQWSIDKLMIETTLKTTEPAVADKAGDSEANADGGAEGAGATNAINAAVRDEMLTQMIKHYRETGWPLPELLQQAVGTVKEKPLVIHEPKEDHQKALQKQLDRVESCIREGNSREASRRWRQVADFARTHHLNHPLLQVLGEKVRELKSWAGFVIQPKKEALLTSMQALVDQDIDPDDKADRIKALQDEWKSLGVADPAIEQPLWEQFKTASDAAFEPCRRHFAVQNELRAKNKGKKNRPL
jgi:exonuclease SbcC